MLCAKLKIAAFLFQFLLVRLKGAYIIKFKGKTIISIPFGAIKSSCFRNFHIFSRFISIPFGAIKRISGRRKMAGQFLFQFLLVRLKAEKQLCSDVR